MVASTRHLCRSVRCLARSVPSKRKPIQVNHHFNTRPFSSAFVRRADESNPTPTSTLSRATSNPSEAKEDSDISGVLEESEYLTPQNPYTPADLSPAERADYELLPKQDQKQYLKLQNHFKAIFESTDTQDELETLADQADREIDREGGPGVNIDFPTARAKGAEVGFWAEEEDDEFGVMEDGDDGFSEEILTSVAESELDLHRDVREYTRIAAWDLPLLQQYAKPFSPPNHSTPLRFRYTTYMGETHPAQHKVVVEFCSKDLLQHPNQTYKISEAQRVKLLKLAGVRYNPGTDTIKMSCEKFNSAAQNKRYLGELAGKLIKEAKDKRDMFEDVPLDLRHYKPKKQVVYPESWKLREGSVQKVLAERKEMKLLDGGEEAEPVDGKIMVETYVRAGAVRAPKVLSR